jgi:hypothetical protein
MWFALSCLAVLGAMIAIKVVMPAPPAVVAMHDQTEMGIAFGPNTAAKSDRLPLPDIRELVDIDPVAPVATTMSAEAPPSSSLETTDKPIDATTRKTIDTTPKKIAHRRWQDANARLIEDSPPRRHAKARPQKINADNGHGKTTSHVFQCRQDGLGNMLRSLDLSPRCSS